METRPSPTHQELVKEAFLRCFSAENDSARDQLLEQLESVNPAIAVEVKALLQTSPNARAVEQVFGFAGSGSLAETSDIGPQNVAQSKRRTATDLAVATGTMIGPYKLLEQIGEGGMGSVFMAQQSSPIKRRVALKIIKPGMDTQHVVARFEAERQALAMMDHSNIAKVLDAGTTPSGLPFFVMELVKGIPITEYCDLEKLAIKDRLRLFIDLCKGVQHAHQKGIIHRDLKPSNVLVTLHDGKPVVKIIDFGIAKAINQDLTDRTLFTQFSQMIGTPLYMSPEQAALSGIDVDTRSDVYSLGILLYELLTGTTPFDKALLKGVGIDEVRRMIRETEPPRPSQRIGQKTTTLKAANDSTLRTKPTPNEVRAQRELKGELDWIVMKALEKDRNRRYESASDFAADITRYLSNEQVQACPPSQWYRLKKLVNRNRALLVTSSLIVISLLAGISASLWQAIRATQAEQRAAAGGAIARQAVDEMYTEIAEQWLAERGGLTATQRQFLEKAQHFYTQFSEGTPQNLDLKVQSLKAMERVGAVQAKLGNFAEAEATNRRLIEACLALRTSTPSADEAAIVLANSRQQLGECLRKIGKSNEGMNSYRQSFADLRSIIEKQISKRIVRGNLARSLQNLAGKLDVVGLSEQADECIQASVKTWQALLAEDPDSWEYRFGAASALKTRGTMQMWWGKQKKEAESTLLEAEKQMVVLLKEKPTDRKCRMALAGIYQNVGVLNSWKGNKLEDATNYYRKSLVQAESLARDYPMDSSVLEQLHLVQGNLASAIISKNSGKHTEESDTLLHQEMELLKRLCNLHQDVIAYQSDYILIAARTLDRLCGDKKLNEAVLFSEECMRWLETVSVPQELNIQNVQHQHMINLFLCNASHTHLEFGRYEKAVEILDKLPKWSRLFDEQFVTHESYKGSDRAKHYLIGCNAKTLILQRPAEILKQCALMAERDPTLEFDERKERVSAFRGRASEFEKEAAKAFASFSAHVHTASLTLDELITVFITIYQKDLIRNGFDQSPFSTENRLVRFVTLRNSRELAKAVFQLPDATDSGLVGLLTAGDEEFRSGEIALKLARNKLEKDPKNGMSKQDYSWALYRVGKYPECYEILKESKMGDATNSAIFAMTLWQLGRNEEAKERLQGAYETELAAYLKRRKADPPGKVVFPTSDMLLRLDREARSMMGLPPKTW